MSQIGGPIAPSKPTRNMDIHLVRFTKALDDIDDQINRLSMVTERLIGSDTGGSTDGGDKVEKVSPSVLDQLDSKIKQLESVASALGRHLSRLETV